MKRTALAVTLAVLLSASPAMARSFWEWAHHPIVYTEDWHRWPTESFMPYLDNGTQPQNIDGPGKGWVADDWIKQNKDGLTLVKKFYRADIIRKQYVHGGKLILVVGPRFYQLGSQDKNRTMAVVDQVWQVTADKDGVFQLYDWDSGKPVGVYTKAGLDLQ